MVAIVSGSSLGLGLTPVANLGQGDAPATQRNGRNGQTVHVNVFTGNLVVQAQDELLVARGEHVAAVRTYNSQGLLDDANADNWSEGTRLQPLVLAGALNTQGSSIRRTAHDGATATYLFDAARGLYRTTEGEGAHDTIAFVAADHELEWRDGSTGATQRYEADGAFRLLATRSPAGAALSYAYDANGRLASVSTAAGEVTWYDYEGANLARVRVVAGGAEQTRVRYAYDATNRLVQVTVDLTPEDNSVADGRTYATSYTYDGISTRIASITQADGTALHFTYVLTGGAWRVASFRDGLGQLTEFSYSQPGQGVAGSTTVRSPQNLLTCYDTDAAGRLLKITAPSTPSGTPTRSFAYTQAGDLASTTDGEGRTTAFGYDAQGNQILQRDALGNTVTRSFDARNQLLTETVYTVPDPDGSGAGQAAGSLTTRLVYDAAGRHQLRFQVSADGRVTEHRYDAAGDRTSSISYLGATYAMGALAATTVPGEAELAAWAAAQDPTRTARVEMTYDARGQLQTRSTYTAVDAMGAGVPGTRSQERFVYDQRGRLLQVVDARGGATLYTHDGFGRVLTATDALGQVTLTQYDDASRRMVATSASGLVTVSAYDAAGRLVAVQQSGPAGAQLGETRYFYDASDRLRMVQDPTGVRSFMLHDAAGRKVADIDGNGTLTEYVRDKAGQVIQEVRYGTPVAIDSRLVGADGLPNTSTTLQEIRPSARPEDPKTWRMYDASGRLAREARTVDNGHTVSITDTRYDGASRVVAVVQYASKVSWSGSSGTPLPQPASSPQDRTTRHFYGGDGLLLGSLDAEGFLTTFHYDGAGRRTESVAHAGATASALRATGSLDQLRPAASPDDIRTLTLYDGAGRVMAQIDGEGYLTEFVHDLNGNVTREVRYANRVSAAAGPGSALPILRPAASPADAATVRSFDALDRLVEETSPDGIVTQYAYDTAGNLASTVRAAGTGEVRTSLARHDLLGRLTGELSAEGAGLLTAGQTEAQVEAIWAQHGTTHAYDAAGRRTSSTDALGHRTWFFYDADGALTHVVNALGEVKETRYDALGRVRETIAYANRIGTGGLVGGRSAPPLPVAHALDARTTFSYHSDGSVASEADALGQATTMAYNAFGDEISRTRPLGSGLSVTETYSVDRRGLRTSSLSDPGGIAALASTTYDAFGRAIRAVDANGNVSERAYDRLGRTVTTRDALDAQRHTSYDAFGRVLAQTDALGQTTTYAYDPDARTMRVTTPEGIRTTTAFTRHGQILSLTDGKGQVTTYSYDRDGRLLRTATSLAATSSRFDAAGRLLETTDARGVQTAYSYDAANRVLTRRVDPAGLNLTTSYQYDGKGQQVSMTDPNGVVTTTQFDKLGRTLRQTVDPAGLNLQTSYAYDAQGRVLTVTAPGGTVTQYAYDKLGRRVQERVDPSGLNLTRSWSYDRNGNAVSTTDPLGHVTRHAYDAANRLVFTVDPLGAVRQTSYDAEGRVVRTAAYATPIDLQGLPAATSAATIQSRIAAQPTLDRVEHRVLDRDGQLAATVDGTGAVVCYAYDADGKVVSRVAHAQRIDLAGWTPGTLPSASSDPARDARLQSVYDAWGRLAYTLEGTGAVVAYQHDHNGNVLQRMAYARPIAPTTPATQAAIGAAVSALAPHASNAVTRNDYDAANRLQWTADGTGAVVQNVYDANGNLVRRIAYANAVGAATDPKAVVASASDRVTSMAYDAANRLVFQVDALNAVTEQAYDAGGNVTRRTAYASPIAAVPAPGTAASAAAIRSALAPDAAADRTTRYGHDAAGRLVLSVGATGAATETWYDAAGNALASKAYAAAVDPATLPGDATAATLRGFLRIDEMDRLVQHTYDAAGRRVHTVDPHGFVTQADYDGLGQAKTTTRYWEAVSGILTTAPAVAALLRPDAARDRVERFSHNAAGQLIAHTDALGGTESYAYDALGRRTGFTNKLGFTWTYAHDAAGRVLSETTPLTELADVRRNEATGELVLHGFGPAAVVHRFAYDALGNLTERVEAAGRREQRTTRYAYDAAGRQVQVVQVGMAVYDAAADAPVSNGAVGTATRTELVKDLEVRTWYDALGNAVANLDVGGALTQKAYDRAGRVRYEVDALGYVTGQVRNAFGDVTELTRYGSGTALANRTVTHASHAASLAAVQAAVTAAGFSHASDRRLLTAHDRTGRAVEIKEPAAYVHVNGADGISRYATAARTTRQVYDAFGQLIESHQLQGLGAQWAITRHYYDKVGSQRFQVDALGYVTEWWTDNRGNPGGRREYATSIGANSPFREPPRSADDREWWYGHDKLGRLAREERVNVTVGTVTGGSTTANAVTQYHYDALGNQVASIDAAGHTTLTHYDALGRVHSVHQPTRASTIVGAAVTPFTITRRDAHGEVVAEHAHHATAAGHAAAYRATLNLVDHGGRTLQSQDAAGASTHFSYDDGGHLAKKWQGVTDVAGLTRTVYEVNLHDKLGQLVETRTPAPSATPGAVAGNGFLQTQIEYNAFGELTRKGTSGGRQEYFDYDTAGRLWRTNSGDGIDRIQLFDVQGNVSAEIRSGGAGFYNVDVTGFATAQAAAGSAQTRRVDVRHDAAGRVTARVEAKRLEQQGGVVVTRQHLAASVASSQVYVPTPDVPGTGSLSGQNQVRLHWNALAGLGSGDIRATVHYLTPVRRNEDGLVLGGGTARTHASAVLEGHVANTGVTLTWGEPATFGYVPQDVGIAQVTRVVVQKKDIWGNWVGVIDQAPGHGANAMEVAAPADHWDHLKLELRAAGSAGDTGWWLAPLADFGDRYRFDAAALGLGSYEYRVRVEEPGLAPRVTATGTVHLGQAPLDTIAIPITYGPAGTGVLAWQTPAAGTQQVLRYRPSGSTGAWSTLAVTQRSATLHGANTLGLAAGTYQFELLWTPPGANAPGAHATGTFHITAPVPPKWVPPVNLPHVTGLAASGGMLSWNAAGATVARYRVAGGSWVALAIDNSQQVQGESGYTGVQRAALSGVPAGSYQVEILVGQPPTAQATANLTVHPQGPGHWTTVYVQVPVSTPRISHYEPVYETRYGTRQASRQVWVSQPPYVSGYDENGFPVWVYPGHWETQYYTETYAYQVQVGQTPVYARDENGNIIHDVTYTTQAQQQWVPGTTPPPTLQVTTPAYTPGFTVPGTPSQYSVSVSTVAGSAAISTTVTGSLSQAAGMNGDQRWLRPTVTQKTDRWGNVTEITDPRTGYWKTTYRYDALNNLVQQTAPDAGDGSVATTRLFHDVLGRQVAVKDARGHVSGQVYDAGGQLLEEHQADGGVVRHRYDAFGDRVQTTDAEGKVVRFSYDNIGRLLRTDRGEVGVYAHDGGTDARLVRTGMVSERWTYDQLGRKLTHTNGNGETLKYTYDLRGNLAATTQPLGQAVRAAHDAQGRKVAETDANGVTSTWSYTYFGRLLERVDLGGVKVSFGYDRAGQLVSQASQRGQSLGYSYDAAGQLLRISDWATGKVTTYMYDLAGRRIRERVAQGSAVYQDNHLAYDGRGQLRYADDARVHLHIEYDAAGNRTRVYTQVNFQGATGETTPAKDRYFQYDAMNRQVVVDAVDAAGNLGQQGHRITYDRNGNRASDTFWGNRVVATAGTTTVTYGETGEAHYTQLPTSYSSSPGYVTESYRYDALDRLQSVARDSVQIDFRQYDAADRVIRSGPSDTLPAAYSNLINASLPPGEMNGHEIRVNRYDANGRLMQQAIHRSTGALKAEISWDPSRTLGSGFTPAGYDAAGNALGYVLRSHEGSYSNRYTTTLARYDGYRELETNGASTKFSAGKTTQNYDVNGHLVAVTDATQPTQNRTFVNDAHGIALYVNQGGKAQRQLVIDGEVLGIYGVDGGSANVADFDFGYAKVSASYPNPSPGAYQVRAGDTLQSIARAAYGDSALWFRIAEANGLASASDLKVGQTLNIPNRVSTIHNNSSTFKPYDPSRIEGDKTPNMPMPAGGGCGGVGKVLMVIVAVVVSAVLGPGLLTAVLSSVASQAVGLATGAIDKFSWKSVALSAVSSGVTSGLSDAFKGMGSFAPIARAVTANVATQGVGVATGLQKKFDWRGVAASAAGTMVGQAVGRALGPNVPADGMGPVRPAAFSDLGRFGGFVRGSIAGFASGLTAATLRGGRVSVQQVAMDAFGNAIGQSLTEQGAALPTRATAQSQEPGDLPSLLRSELGDDESQARGLTFAEDMAVRRTAIDLHRWKASRLLERAGASNTNTFDLDIVNDRIDYSGHKPIYDFGDPTVGGVVGDQFAMRGGVRVHRGNAIGRGGPEAIDPVPSRINGVNVNQRVEALIKGATDLTGAGSLYRDIKLVSNLMSSVEQERTLANLRSSLQGKLGMMRILPSAADLGAVPITDSYGTRYDNSDLIDRYSDAIRKVELMKSGVIELDTRSMMIKSIGAERLRPELWVDENTRRYQKAFAVGVETAERLYDEGVLRRFRADMPRQLQVGLYADDIARSAVMNYNASIGVPEGAGQLLSLNRWSYDPSGSGLYNRIDLLMDLGPSRNNGALVFRTAIEGKASPEAVRASGAQLQRDVDWVTPRVLTVTPQATLPYMPVRRSR